MIYNSSKCEKINILRDKIKSLDVLGQTEQIRLDKKYISECDTSGIGIEMLPIAIPVIVCWSCYCGVAKLVDMGCFYTKKLFNKNSLDIEKKD